MNIKANIQLSRHKRSKKGPAGTLLNVRYRIGHKVPMSLRRVIVVTALVIAEFWTDTGCGSPEEMIEELHRAGEDLAQKVLTFEPSKKED